MIDRIFDSCFSLMFFLIYIYRSYVPGKSLFIYYITQLDALSIRLEYPALRIWIVIDIYCHFVLMLDIRFLWASSSYPALTLYFFIRLVYVHILSNHLNLIFPLTLKFPPTRIHSRSLSDFSTDQYPPREQEAKNNKMLIFFWIYVHLK